MTESTESQSASSIDMSAGHLSMRIDGRPEVRFHIAARPGRTVAAMLTTLAVQVGVLGALLYVGRVGLQVAGVLPEKPPTVVFLPSQGPGGGGGGGGNRMKEPPKKAEIPKPKAQVVTTLPAEPKPDPTPTLQFNIPVTTLASVEIPGAVEAPAGLPTLSQGSGSGGGGGTGRGTGIGSGTGSGLGPGSGGGTGGGVYKGGGSGVNDPVPVESPRPGYTPEAMRARVQGEVWVECTVTVQGRCSDTHVVRSLDTKYGLDQEAVNTANKWRFRPGTFQGRPVDVIIVIGIEFSLR